MAAREKRIFARMNTMPAIKLDLSIFETLHEDPNKENHTQDSLIDTTESAQDSNGSNGKVIL
jgi:hypothetical protein